MHNHSNGNELQIVMQIKLIFLTIVEHQDSLRNRDKQQLRNGPLAAALSLLIRSIVGFHSRDQQPCFSTKTKENVCIMIVKFPEDLLGAPTWPPFLCFREFM